MRDELLTRHAVEQLELDPVVDGYFDRVLAAAHASERRALRRTRQALAACGVLALIGVGTATAMLLAPPNADARTVEGTLSCAAQPRAGLHFIQFGASAAVPGLYPGGVELFSVRKIAMNKVFVQLAMYSNQTTVTVDRAACRTIRRVVPFGGRDLRSNGVVTPDFLGQFDSVCKVASSRIVVGYRATFGSSGLVRAQVAVETDTRRPAAVAYVDWRPKRVASFLGYGCTLR